jgi:hypothetical protein
MDTTSMIEKFLMRKSAVSLGRLFTVKSMVA